MNLEKDLEALKDSEETELWFIRYNDDVVNENKNIFGLKSVCFEDTYIWYILKIVSL